MKAWLQPLPPSFQTVLLQCSPLSVSEVPPTAITSGESAGKFAACVRGQRLVEISAVAEETVITTPGWSYGALRPE